MNFLKTPVITKAEIKKAKACNDDYAYTMLNRLLNQNKIRQLKKGKYTAIDNVYVIFSNLYVPSYISFWTASYLKGYTKQIVNTIHIVTTRNYPSISYENYLVIFHKISKKLFFGYEKKKQGDYFVFIAEDEKLLLDSIILQQNIGNFDELLKIVKSVSLEKIISYLNIINNCALNKRVGFLLEYFRGVDIFGKVNTDDKNYVLLTMFNQPKFIDRKWKVKHDIS